jgi:hypothetical protein
MNVIATPNEPDARTKRRVGCTKSKSFDAPVVLHASSAGRRSSSVVRRPSVDG